MYNFYSKYLADVPHCMCVCVAVVVAVVDALHEYELNAEVYLPCT